MAFSEKREVKVLLVTVIVPCYNQGKYLTEALHSLTAQTYTHWECIIVNDGSTDDTADIAKKWVDADRRFSCIYQPNMGLSAARNRGLEYAKGDFIQFLDADDVLLPFKIEKQLHNIKDNIDDYKPIVSYTDFSFGFSDNIYRLSSYYISSQFDSANYVAELISRWESSISIPCHCFLFSASIFRELKIRFDTSLKNHEDFDCWMNIFNLHPNIKFVNEKLCIYRLSVGSMSKNMKTMGEGFLEVINKHMNSDLYSTAEIALLKKKRRSVLVSYRRFDLMNKYEKILSIDALCKYYFNRVLQKMRLGK